MILANITSQFRFKLMSNVYKKWLKPNAKVLDIGCGNGVISHQLAKKFSIMIYGCDIDKYLVYDFPFTKLKSNSKLPYKNSNFDVAMFNDVLHHTKFDNQIKMIKEALRVAKIVLIFEVKPTFVGKTFDYLINKLHHSNMEILFTFRNSSDWISLFKKNNLEIKTVNVKSPFFYPFSHVAFCLKKKTY